jgi:hypothetical protein
MNRSPLYPTKPAAGNLGSIPFRRLGLPRFSNPYLFLVSRTSSGPVRVKSTTSSPVTVLMSWCRLNALTPVTSWTIASRTGRSVSPKWVRVCLSKFEFVT